MSGAYPIIRAGGATSSIAKFVADQKEALIAKFDSPTSDRPSKVSIGPTWIESFQQFPETKYIYGLNFNDGGAGLDQAVLEATNAYAGLGNSLYAFEIGNELYELIQVFFNTNVIILVATCFLKYGTRLCGSFCTRGNGRRYYTPTIDKTMM